VTLTEDAMAPDVGSHAEGRLGRNIASLATGQLLTWTMAMAATLIVPRALGPAQMGALVAALSVTSILAIVAGFVTTDFLVRDMVVRSGKLAKLAGAALLLRVAVTPVVLAAVYVYVHIAGMSQEETTIFLLIAVAVGTNMLVDPMQAAFRSLERMNYTALSDVIVHSSSGVIAIALVLAGGRAAEVALASAAVGVLVLVVNVRWARRAGIVNLRGSAAEIPALIRRGLPYWPSQLTVLVYLFIDSVILSIVQSPEVVGWYGVSMRLFGTLLFVPTILGMAWFPRLVRAFETDACTFSRSAQPFLEIVVALSIPVCVATVIGARPLIELIYGPAYSGAVPVMITLGFCAVPMYLGVALGQVLIVTKRPMTLTALLGGGIVANVLLNLVLIPVFDSRYHNGALGSAASLLATELLITGAGLMVVGRGLIDVRVFRRVPRVSAAALAMYLVATVAQPLGVVALVLAGVACVCVAMRLHILTDDENAALVSFVRTRLWRRVPSADHPGAAQ
jgi:O-antigen/teichoic acid export membrane protein